MKQLFYFSFFALVLLFGCNDDSDNAGLESFSEGQAGSLARFITLNNRLYIIDDEKLSIFNTSNPSELNFVRSTTLGPGVETIFPYQDLLFFGTNTGMLIYDNSDPDDPKYISRYEHVESCDPVTVKGDYAYLTLRSSSFLGERNLCFRGVSELQVINVEDLENPYIENRRGMTNPIGLTTYGETLFVCDNQSGLHQYNISDAVSPTIEQVYFNIKGHDLIINGDLMMVIATDQLQQFKITDTGLEELGQILL